MTVYGRYLEKPVGNRPYVTYALIIANILMFVISWGDNAYEWGSANHDMILGYRQYYRLISAMFLHADSLHIAVNMFALLMIGNGIERYIGHTRFGMIYFLSGLVGSILSAARNDGNIYSVGASGAVFGLVGAAMVYAALYRDSIGSAGNGSVYGIIVIILWGVWHSIRPNSGIDNIDNWGHLGGFLGGVVVSLLVSYFFELVYEVDREGTVHTVSYEKHQDRLQLLVIICTIFILLLVATGIPTLLWFTLSQIGTP